MTGRPATEAEPVKLTELLILAALWMLFGFMLWYYLSAFHVLPARLAAGAILQQVLGDDFRQIVAEPSQAFLFQVETNIPFTFRDGTTEALGFIVNPLIFSYGLPLLFGLVMGSNVGWRRKVAILLIGYGVITLVQIWGVVWESLKLLAFNFGDQAFAVVQDHGVSATVIALCYQLGTLILPALAIALIALVQAAGVSQSVPNPDGEYPDPSGDFRGQGIANMAVGLAGGLPVGGSVSGTALVRSSGAQSRWANIFTGLFGLVVVLLFAPLVELIPLAALAGLLVTVGAGMVNVPRLRTVWNTGPAPLTIMVITFVATLFTPIQVAVILGVVLHILLYIFRSAEAVRIERVVPQEDGTFAEGEVPGALPSGEIVVLQPIGSLFFAGVAELEEHLPKVGQAQGTAVIIRLRDRDEVGSTFIRTMQRYTESLQAGGNVLMLEGLDEKVLEQIERTKLLDLIGEENVFLAQPQHGASLRQALAAAEEWLVQDQENRG